MKLLLYASLQNYSCAPVLSVFLALRFKNIFIFVKSAVGEKA